MRKKTRYELDRMKEDHRALWYRVQEIAAATGLILVPATEQPARYVKSTSAEAKAYAKKLKPTTLLINGQLGSTIYYDAP